MSDLSSQVGHVMVNVRFDWCVLSYKCRGSVVVVVSETKPWRHQYSKDMAGEQRHRGHYRCCCYQILYGQHLTWPSLFLSAGNKGLCSGGKFTAPSFRWPPLDGASRLFERSPFEIFVIASTRDLSIFAFLTSRLYLVAFEALRFAGDTAYMSFG